MKTINMIKLEKMPIYWEEMKENQWYSIDGELSIFELKDSFIDERHSYLKSMFKNQKWEAFSFDKLFKDIIQARNFEELEKKLLHRNIKVKGIKEEKIESDDLTII